MQYDVVYDAARDFAGWQIIVGWVVLFAFFMTMVFWTERIPRFIYFLLRIRENDTDWGRTIVFLGVLIIGTFSVTIIKANLELRSISKKNDCTQVAGVVKDFQSLRFGRTYDESFKLNDVEFEYNTSFMVTGFNVSAADGGPIFEGAKVKLCYIDDWGDEKITKVIIRVETASETVQ